MNLKTCHLGTSINTRTEYHGDEQVPAMDISISEIPLGRLELEELIGQGRFESLFYLRHGDDFPLPFLPDFKPFQLKHKFEGAEVTLLLGLNRKQIFLPNVKLSKLKFEPMPGGLTMLALTVHCTPELDKAATLFLFLDKDAEIEIAFGKVANDDEREQHELGLTNAENVLDFPGQSLEPETAELPLDETDVALARGGRH